MSQSRRAIIECIFGWGKQHGTMRKTKHRAPGPDRCPLLAQSDRLQLDPKPRRCWRASAVAGGHRSRCWAAALTPSSPLHRWLPRAVRLRRARPRRCVRSLRWPDRRQGQHQPRHHRRLPAPEGAFSRLVRVRLSLLRRAESILVRVEHSRRTLVPKVDFISAPGGSPENVFRTGGPIALVTNRCLFDFDRARRGFRLASVHPGHSVAEVIETGASTSTGPLMSTTPAPSADTLHMM